MPETNDSTRRLHHAVPSWVPAGETYHIRIRLEGAAHSLTDPSVAPAVLRSASFYHVTESWFCHLFLLMPDHCHALLSFPQDRRMSVVVGKWKSWQRQTLGLKWQDNFFDHRIRDNAEFHEKAEYIRRNPIAKNLCAAPDDWPWALDQHTTIRWLEVVAGVPAGDARASQRR